MAETDRLAKLSIKGDPLEILERNINWDLFSPIINAAFATSYGKSGRPPFDRLMMFKLLVLQRLYGISDDRIEYLINDRISFQRFLKLTLSDKVPDAKTIWRFRQALMQKNAMETLFQLWEEELGKQGIFAFVGSIVEPSFSKTRKRQKLENDDKLSGRLVGIGVSKEKEGVQTHLC